MRVNHSGRYVLVAEQFLNSSDVVPVFEQMRGEAVPESVAARRFPDARGTNRKFDCVLQILFGEMMSPCFT